MATKAPDVWSAHERPYDAVGREPMNDDALGAAISAWDSDHSDDAMLRRQGAVRLRMLNDRARKRAAENDEITDLIDKASATGAPPPTWDEARAVLDERRERDAADARAARVHATRQAAGLVDPTGRLQVDDVQRMGEKLREPDGTRPTLERVAEALGRSPRWVSEICRSAGGYRKVVPNRK